MVKLQTYDWVRYGSLDCKDGACVLFYPESTVTRDPEFWPMMAKTGVARLALATGAPVIPVAHWGAQNVLPYGSFKLRVIPRKTVKILAGPPVDLSEFAGRVSDSGEGRWTIHAAIDEGAPATVLSAALYDRFTSRGEADFADRLLSAMRKEFGGHDEKQA